VDWVGLVEAPDQITAEMWCELLDKEGVAAFTKTTSAGGIYWGSALGPLAATGCWVMVQEEDLERAAAILQPLIEPKRRPRRRRSRR